MPSNTISWTGTEWQPLIVRSDETKFSESPLALRKKHRTMVLQSSQDKSQKLSQGTQTEVCKLQNTEIVSNTARVSPATSGYQR